MKTKILILIAIYYLIISSCNKTDDKIMMQENAVMELMCLKKISPPLPAQNGKNNPKLIKKGNMTILSSDIESTKKLIYKFVATCNGYIESENLEKNEYESIYTISLNIQAAYFDRFVQLIDSAHLNIIARNFSVADVTLAYVDDSTRLANKKKLEKRYLEIMEKADDIEEMLKVEEKLEEIRADAEVREAQLRVMDKQIAYSQFTMEIEKRNNYIPASQKDSFFYKTSQGIVSGWNGIKNSFVFLISIWPVYLLLGVIYFLVKYIFKKVKKNRVKAL